MAGTRKRPSAPVKAAVVSSANAPAEETTAAAEVAPDTAAVADDTAAAEISSDPADVVDDAAAAEVTPAPVDVVDDTATAEAEASDDGAPPEAAAADSETSEVEPAEDVDLSTVQDPSWQPVHTFALLRDDGPVMRAAGHILTNRGWVIEHQAVTDEPERTDEA